MNGTSIPGIGVSAVRSALTGPPAPVRKSSASSARLNPASCSDRHAGAEAGTEDIEHVPRFLRALKNPPERVWFSKRSYKLKQLVDHR